MQLQNMERGRFMFPESPPVGVIQGKAVQAAAKSDHQRRVKTISNRLVARPAFIPASQHATVIGREDSLGGNLGISQNHHHAFVYFRRQLARSTHGSHEEFASIRCKVRSLETPFIQCLN